MSAVAVENPPQVTRASRSGRPVPDFADLHDGAEDFQAWEIHSELVLVSPELRRRSLELLRERERERALPPPPSPPPPRPVLVPPPVDADHVEAEPSSILRYVVHRVGEALRLGLMIIGALVVLAMLAQAIAH